MSGGTDASSRTAPKTAATPTPILLPRRSPTWVFALIAVLILVVAAVFVGYEEHWFGGSSSAATSCGSAVTLQGDGAQIVVPLMAQWEAAYNTATGNQVNYPGSGSGTGLTDFSEHPPLLDFAVTDDPLDSAETAALPSAALTLPITSGALAIIYNVPGVSVHLNLTGPVIAEIYLGTITNWNDSAIRAINPGVSLPNATITTVHRSDSAGTTYVLTDFLSQGSAAWNSTVGKGIAISWPKAPTQTAVKGNSAVLSTVETTADTLGYSDLTDVLLAKNPVAYAAVQNPKGNFIVPTLASTASAITDKTATTSFPTSSGNWYNVSMVNAQGAADYPLATFIYMYVYQAANEGFQPDLTKAQVIVQWLDWALTTGQTYSNATGLYYVALPSAVVAIDDSGIQTMTFNGKAIPACS